MVSRRLIVIAIAVVCAASVAGALAGYRYVQYTQQREKERVLLEARKVLWRGLAGHIDKEIAQFRGEASIVVKDLKTGWQYSHGAQTRMPAASLVKLPIMAACFHARQQGKLDFSKLLNVDATCKVSGSGDLDKQICTAPLPVSKVIELMITKSDNTATNMLINELGYEYLNGYFKEVGLGDTSLVRKMMDFRNRGKGVENFTSARDMAFMLEAIYRKRLENTAVSENCLSLLKGQHMRDRLPALLPSGSVVAHKTGLERNVCHDVGIIYTRQGDFLVSVMTQLAPTSRQAKRFIARVAFDVYNAYKEL